MRDLPSRQTQKQMKKNTIRNCRQNLPSHWRHCWCNQCDKAYAQFVEYSTQTLSSRCDIISNAINVKSVFCQWFACGFSICHFGAILDIEENWKVTKLPRRGEILHGKCYWKLGMLSAKPHVFSVLWASDWCSSLNIEIDTATWKFDLFFNLLT